MERLELGLVAVVVYVREVAALHDERLIDPAAEDVLGLERVVAVVLRDHVLAVVEEAGAGVWGCGSLGVIDLQNPAACLCRSPADRPSPSYAYSAMVEPSAARVTLTRRFKKS